MVGIKSLRPSFYFINSLKRDLLFFDKIGLIDIAPFDDEKFWINAKAVHNEIDFLLDKGVVFRTSKENVRTLKLEVDLNQIQELLNLGNSLATKYGNDTSKFFQDNQLPILEEILVRLEAIYCNWQLENSFDALPIVHQFNLPISLAPKKQEVTTVVLNKLPIPDDTTPWEKILEFKSNTDNKGKFGSLKVWINKMTKTDFSINEIEEELEDLVYQFEKAMDIHKIKFKTGSISFILNSLAGFTGSPSVAALSAGKTLFSLYNERLNLLSLELTAPGKEIAYIVKAKEQFK